MRRMFSEKQIISLVKEAVKNEDLLVKSLDIKEPVAVFDVTPYALEGRTLTERYNKAILTSGLLLIVLNYVLKNETASAQAQANITFRVSVPEEVGDKIICFNGEKLSDPYVASQQITSILGVYGQYLTSQGPRAILKSGKNTMDITIVCPALNAGSSEQFTARQWLSLF